VKDRIYGYETEYGVLITEKPEPTGAGFYSVHSSPLTSRPEEKPRLKRMRIYDYLEYLISAQMKVLTASYRKKGIFMENGGLFNYEALHSHFLEGLVEMATPECTSPRDAALYHEAQTKILVETMKELNSDPAALDPSFSGSIFLGKSNVDAEGKCMASHENYLIEDKPGLFSSFILHIFIPILWILHLIILGITYLPLIIIAPPLFIASLGGAFLSGLLGGIPRLAPLGNRIREFIFGYLLGEDFIIGVFARYHGDFSRLLFLPWVSFFSTFLPPFVFTRHRAGLAPFLATRTLFCGSGKVNVPVMKHPPTRAGMRKTSAAGEKPAPLFQISQRADAMRSLCRIYFDDAKRPLFDMRDFFLEPLSVLKNRKRLHILYSDTNMSSIGVYLKIGITGLILEMIEEGHRFEKVHLADPLKALRTVSCDLSLKEKLPLRSGEKMTALEIQRYYLQETKLFYRERTDRDPWVDDLLEKWEYVLGCLEFAPHLLYRKIDWVTKKDLIEEVLRGRSTLQDIAAISEWASYLMSRGGGSACYENPHAEVFKALLGENVMRDFLVFLKAQEITLDDFCNRWRLYFEILKVDFKFHQLDNEGYYFKLLDSQLVDTLFSTEEIEHARLNPPRGTRAHIRGELVRRYGYQADPSGSDVYGEKIVQTKSKIGWNKFYINWPWKKIVLKDPFNAEFSSIEKEL
jgi:Pup amidohydrolase